MTIPLPLRMRNQREGHYIAQIQDLEEQIENLQGENADLRGQLETMQAREELLHRVQEECQRTRMELITSISEKEQAIKHCKGAVFRLCFALV